MNQWIDLSIKQSIDRSINQAFISGNVAHKNTMNRKHRQTDRQTVCQQNKTDHKMQRNSPWQTHHGQTHTHTHIFRTEYDYDMESNPPCPAQHWHGTQQSF